MNGSSRRQKVRISVSEWSFMSRAGSVLVRQRGMLLPWMWGTIYNQNKNKEKQWTGHWNTLKILQKIFTSLILHEDQKCLRPESVISVVGNLKRIKISYIKCVNASKKFDTEKKYLLKKKKRKMWAHTRLLSKWERWSGKCAQESKVLKLLRDELNYDVK